MHLARERELTPACRNCLVASRSIDRREPEDAMRGSLWALMAIGVMAAIGAAPAAAGGMPFCIKGCEFGGSLGDCSFSSYQQCQATASGRDAWCAANPYFSASNAMQPNRGPSSRRKF
jgi:hypothetical protein